LSESSSLFCECSEHAISHDQRILIEVCGRGEWIADPALGGRSLHIYRLGAADWLVSEVGRDSEGRGSTLRAALAALSAGVSAPNWWELLLDTLDRGVESR
jgi:hypothetical protein